MKTLTPIIVGIILITIGIAVFTLNEKSIDVPLGVVVKEQKIKSGVMHSNPEALKVYIKRTALNGEIPHFNISIPIEKISQAYIDVYEDLGNKTEKNMWKDIRKGAKEKGFDVKDVQFK